MAAFLVSLIYLVSPAICMPLFYDFHENKFLPFFIFWFIYFFLEKKDRRALVFLILALMIKEDTAIYMVILSLFFMIGMKEWKRGGAALAIAGIYFLVVITFIQSHGLGVMEGHYGLYFMPGQAGVFAALHSAGLAGYPQTASCDPVCCLRPYDELRLPA